MSLIFPKYQQLTTELCARAEKLFGLPAVPVDFCDVYSEFLLKHARRKSIQGFDVEPALLRLADDQRKHSYKYGLLLYELSLGDIQTPLLKINIKQLYYPGGEWFVPQCSVRRIYRWLRKQKQSSESAAPPLLPENRLRELWDNTLGCLLRNRQQLRQYGIARKRGVLLIGTPGNGKTMTCRWLRAECFRHNLAWREVTYQTYSFALRKCDLRELFNLDRPGVIQFDDFDWLIRNRGTQDSPAVGDFLTQLDGMNPPEGVVFLFTTNLSWNELDPAARRPGRLDYIQVYAPPDAVLRERFMLERWPREVLDQLPLPELVIDTAGWSFAELEEARKRAIIGWLDQGDVDWNVIRQFQAARDELQPPSQSVGFGSLFEGSELPRLSKSVS